MQPYRKRDQTKPLTRDEAPEIAATSYPNSSPEKAAQIALALLEYDRVDTMHACYRAHRRADAWLAYLISN